MTLPNIDNALIEDDKFLNYFLNENHPIGKHKAIMFKKILGITQLNYLLLKEKILEGIRNNYAIVGKTDNYGVRYLVDFLWDEKNKNIVIRTAWIILNDEDFPRLVTAFIL